MAEINWLIWNWIAEAGIRISNLGVRKMKKNVERRKKRMGIEDEPEEPGV